MYDVPSSAEQWIPSNIKGKYKCSYLKWTVYLNSKTRSINGRIFEEIKIWRTLVILNKKSFILTSIFINFVLLWIG